jgi:hypothetical protein
MTGATCACGAVSRFIPVEFDQRTARSRGPFLEWRGGRIGIDKLAVEGARHGVNVCPACQHRACVFMLVRQVRTDAGDARTGT